MFSKSTAMGMAFCIAAAFGQNASAILWIQSTADLPGAQASVFREGLRGEFLSGNKIRPLDPRGGFEPLWRSLEDRASNAPASSRAPYFGRLMGANFVLQASLSRSNGAFQFAARLLEAESGKTVARAERSAPTLDALAASAGSLARELEACKAAQDLNALDSAAYLAKTFLDRGELQYVDLGDRPFGDEELLAAIPSPETLRAFRLRNARLTDRFALELLARMTNLAALDLHAGAAISEAGFLGGLQNHTKLVALDLSQCAHLSDAVILAVTARNKDLRYLDFSRTFTSDRSFALGVASLNRLETLKRSGNGVNECLLTCEGVPSALWANPGLRTLVLDGNLLGDCLATILGLVPARFSELDLSENPLSPAALQRIRSLQPQCIVRMESNDVLRVFGAEVSNRHMKAGLQRPQAPRIEFFGTAVTDASYLYLCTNHPGLRFFGVTSGLVTDHFLTNVAPFFAVQPHFFFSNCPGITDGGIKDFLLRAAKMEEMTLIETSVTRAGADAIREKFPHCRLTYR
ncbi:MAG: hypothetical protein J0L75_03100 [Spirochaetes bacterium]|nr:hypothetical protein [Spirochaetota bacterium]